MPIHVGSVVRDDYGFYGVVVAIDNGVPTVVWWTDCQCAPYEGAVPLVVLS